MERGGFALRTEQLGGLVQLQLEDSPVEEQLKTDRPVGGLLQFQLELIKKFKTTEKSTYPAGPEEWHRSVQEHR